MTKLVKYSNRVLSLKCKPVSLDDPTLDKLIFNLKKEMEDYGGAGIAAPQIGVPLRIFIVDKFVSNTEHEGKLVHMVCINPELEFPHKEVQNEGGEGCLSFPGIYITVKRPASVILRAIDEYGKPFEKKTEGFLARVIQHEYDHLEGITMLSKVGSVKKELLKGKLRKNARKVK